MKRKNHSVLRSRTGASITFALLLFLVCAVVGALVLTAGTAAAGRISNLAESDQRFYSVSSAAELLAGELSGKKVTIERTRVLTTVTNTTYSVDLGGSGSVVSVVGTPEKSTVADYTTKINDNKPLTATVSGYPGAMNNGVEIGSGMSFLDTYAAKQLFSNSTNAVCNTDAAMDDTMKNGNVQSGELRLVHEGSREGDLTYGVKDPDSMAVDCIVYVLADGTMQLTLSNETEENGATYSLRVTLSPTITESESETTKTESTTRTDLESGDGYKESVTTVTTLTKTSVIYWTVSGVEKLVLSDAEGGD